MLIFPTKTCLRAQTFAGLLYKDAEPYAEVTAYVRRPWGSLVGVPFRITDPTREPHKLIWKDLRVSAPFYGRLEFFRLVFPWYPLHGDYDAVGKTFIPDYLDHFLVEGSEVNPGDQILFTSRLGNSPFQEIVYGEEADGSASEVSVKQYEHDPMYARATKAECCDDSGKADACCQDDHCCTPPPSVAEGETVLTTLRAKVWKQFASHVKQAEGWYKTVQAIDAALADYKA